MNLIDPVSADRLSCYPSQDPCTRELGGLARTRESSQRHLPDTKDVVVLVRAVILCSHPGPITLQRDRGRSRSVPNIGPGTNSFHTPPGSQSSPSPVDKNGLCNHFSYLHFDRPLYVEIFSTALGFGILACRVGVPGHNPLHWRTPCKEIEGVPLALSGGPRQHYRTKIKPNCSISGLRGPTYVSADVTMLGYRTTIRSKGKQKLGPKPM